MRRTSSATGAIAIAAAPPVASGTSITETEQTLFTTAVATFNDPSGSAADYTATIDWGDGSPTSTGTVTGSSGHFSVSGTHTYAEETSAPSPFTVSALIRNLTLWPGRLRWGRSRRWSTRRCRRSR